MKEFFHAKVQIFLVESKRYRLLACIGGRHREGLGHWSLASLCTPNAERNYLPLQCVFFKFFS